MFVDYYEILNIDISSTEAEIKSAFKKQALKWHPDKNPGVNTNDRMRLIIEAHLILKDPEARKRYDVEYLNYKSYQQSKQKNEQSSAQSEKQSQEEKQTYNKKTTTNNEYSVSDDILNKWMENAAKQASEYLAQTLDDFKGIASAGAKTFVNELIPRLISGVVIIIVLSLIARGCN